MVLLVVVLFPVWLVLVTELLPLVEFDAELLPVVEVEPELVLLVELDAEPLPLVEVEPELLLLAELDAELVEVGAELLTVVELDAELLPVWDTELLLVGRLLPLFDRELLPPFEVEVLDGADAVLVEPPSCEEPPSRVSDEPPLPHPVDRHATSSTPVPVARTRRTRMGKPHRRRKRQTQPNLGSPTRLREACQRGTSSFASRASAPSHW